MRSVVVVLRSSKTQRVFLDTVPVPQILGKVAEWLAGAEQKARDTGTCVSFSVEVHQSGADCDHERRGEY